MSWVRMIKKKMELPISTIDNPENKYMYLVRAQYSTDKKREASLAAGQRKENENGRTKKI